MKIDGLLFPKGQFSQTCFITNVLFPQFEILLETLPLINPKRQRQAYQDGFAAETCIYCPEGGRVQNDRISGLLYSKTG